MEIYEYSSSNYWVYGTGYEFDEESGTYNLTGVDVCKYADCSESLVNKYLINLESSTSARPYYSVTKEGAKTISTSGLTNIYQVTSATSSILKYKFTKSIETTEINEALLSSTEDDYGTSYYFRGNVENNYVNYAGMCWRIVRIQGDGGIKLVLADTNGECNASTYSKDNNASAYVSGAQGIEYFNDWMDYSAIVYENSYAEKTLNSWMNGGSYNYMLGETDDYNTHEGMFTSHISNEEQEKLMYAEWCSDTSITSYIYYNSSAEILGVNDPNIEEIFENYGAYDRVINRTKASPTLKCNNKGINNSRAIKYSANIGLLTTDELAFAGAAQGITPKYYLSTNANEINSWSLSPAFVDSWPQTGDNYYFVTFLTLTGEFTFSDVAWDNDTNAAVSLRPSVVLRSDVTIETGGNGTQTNPYVIS